VSLKKLNIFMVVLLTLFQMMPTAFADFLPIQVYVIDTVAGYPAALRTSLVNPYQDVRFVVEKPDGAVVQIPAQADMEGIAKTDFYGHQTKIAGKYRVAVVYPGSATSSPQTTFTVYPDQISTSQSTFRSTLQLLEAGTDVTFLVVTLYDQYRNPIANHHVRLISSRSEDKIEALQGGVTDHNGRANFKVRSQFPGISIFTALDASVNQVLEDREEVVFLAPSAPTVAGSPFAASILAADIGQGQVIPGPVDHFDIEDVPFTVKVSELLSTTVIARDKNDNIAKNYTGTILFSVPDDENAVLPSNGEYAFKAADQGQFTFDLSLKFSQIGDQVIQVFDKNNFKIAGEFPVEVIPVQAVIPVPAVPTLVIKSPAEGAELGSNLVIITGQGNENINLKVFDNDVKIGDTETDGDGFFSLEAKNLESGSHSFYVMSEAGEVSKAVTILIDTIAPVLNAFEIEPEGPVLPAEQVTITVQSEPGLEEAKIRLQGVEEPLQESVSEPGTYSATVVAPAQDGNFPVDVILIDDLSNKAELLNKGTITVETPAPALPPTVEGLEGVPGDTIVQLTWNPVVDHERPIQNYRIYFGTTFDQLDQTVASSGAPEWELTELTNDTQYFIAIKAVDTQGLESEELSVTIGVTPVAPEPEPEPIVEPEPVVAPPLEPPSVIAAPQIQATPYDSAAVLTWSPFAGVRAFYYKVFIGFSSGQYSDYVVTPDNRTTITIPDLINNVPYYFAVAALDINRNQISALSQEMQVTPTGVAFRPAAPSPIPFAPPPVIYREELRRVPRVDETGPEAIWVVLASILFAHFLYHHKRRVLNS